MTNATFKVWNIMEYKMCKKDFRKFLKEDWKEYELDDLISTIDDTVDNLNLRVHNKTNYILFGDLDGYSAGIERFKTLFIKFLKESYGLSLNNLDIKYTQNYSKNGYYHFSIPKYFCKTEKIKEIIKNFKKYYPEFGKRILDTTIYSEKWFRYPNQLKENEKGTEHKIVNGNIIDFIVEHIPDNSIDINNIVYIAKNEKDDTNKNKTKKKRSVEEIIANIEKMTEEFKKEQEEEQNYEKILSIEEKKKIQEFEALLGKSKNFFYYNRYRLFFDRCYNKDRFDNYEDWTTVGMALMNIYGIEAFPLFDYFSSKGKKYDGREKTLIKYKSFRENFKYGYKMNKIYIMAKMDNKKQYIKIMSKCDFSFKSDDVAEKVKELAGDRFIVQIDGKGKKTYFHLYCFNGKYWENNNVQFRKFLSGELYDYYKELINDLFGDVSVRYMAYKQLIDKLRTVNFKKDIMTSYEVIGLNDEVKFDEKWWLLGFKNCVYDLKESKFRDYRFDDYITMNCGYEWREPTKKEIERMNNIIKKIMPIDEERKLYLVILATSLEGRQLEKFIVFNGSGGNGKGLINDLLLLALGEYGIIGNNSILFEKSKTSVNPEKANLHKKRLIIFREPPQREKFQNSPLKELTGGGQFSARGLYEDNAQKILHGTAICECNKRPLLAEEVTNAEIRRFLDLLFRSVFTDDKELIDEKHYIFEGKPKYKEKDFQELHKFALLKILFDAHKEYKQNNYKFDIPTSVKERTREYLESSCDILTWFNENYEKTNDEKDILKLKDVFNEFNLSELRSNMTKLEKRRYNYKYMCDYFRQNPFMKNFYKPIYKPSKNKSFTNILIGWITNEVENETNSQEVLDY